MGVDGLENFLKCVFLVCLIGAAIGFSGIGWGDSIIVGLGIYKMGF